MPVKKRLYVVSVDSESGDHYGPFLFEQKPSDKVMLAFLQKHTSPEDAEATTGPGWHGTYLYLTGVLRTVYSGV
jgi:hypothetical protein